MLDAALDLLRCPHCGASLARHGGTVRCAAGHSFDVARQGYLSLLPGDARLGSADTASMVLARERFLVAGHFDPLAGALAAEAERALVGGAPEGCVLEPGAGTGWYLARVMERLPGRLGLALDISKPALRRAARAHERIAAVGADVWGRLPIRDGVAALALSVFAPRNAAELARVLRPGGALVVASPTDRHLADLVRALGLLGVGQRKREALATKLDPHLGPPRTATLEWTFELSRADALDAAGMGPSAWHADRADRADAVGRLGEPVTVTGSVDISVRRRP